VQRQLENLYQNYLETLFSDKELEEMIENHSVSSPQLLDIETPRGNYLDSEYKIILIGKETNGWFNANERKEEGLTHISGQLEKYIHSLKKNIFTTQHRSKLSFPNLFIYLFIDL
jgi:hypothetical protein